MVKLAISYFYRLRFFTPTMLPLSTAVWDPKWFNQNGQPYFDKRGVINGWRFETFMPDSTCANLCRGSKGCAYTPDMCKFLKKYREMLDKLDYDKVIGMLTTLANNAKTIMKLGEDPTLVFMVYEPPYKKCSEREPLRAWFKDHGYDIPEV